MESDVAGGGKLTISRSSRRDRNRQERRSRMKKRVVKNKDGSALIVAIVIMVVLMMLGLSLLLVSYSLFSTVTRKQHLEQSRELAETLSRQIEAEITISTPAAADEDDYPLWKYLKDNISVKNNASKWPYFDDDADGHKAADAYRFFSIQSDVTSGGADAKLAQTAKDLLSDTCVLMYWETEHADMAAGDPTLGDEVLNNEAVLTVEVTCTAGDETTTITTRYVLTIDSTSGAWSWGKE